MVTPVVPWASKKLFADTVKLSAATVKLSVVVALSAPDVPVIVNVEVPTAAVLFAVSVSVAFPTVGFGLHDAVTPLGKPVTDMFTLPENPPAGLTFTYAVDELPCPTVTPP